MKLASLSPGSFPAAPRSAADAQGSEPFHRELRRLTKPDHERVDTLFGDFVLDDPESYRDFLVAHAEALVPVERWLEGGPTSGFFGGQAGSEALSADLAALGRNVPAWRPLDWRHDSAAQWGAAYVIEGSRLGGLVLARRVGRGLPHAYLTGAQAPGGWRAFLAALDRSAQAAGPFWRDRAVAAARRTFALFTYAAQPNRLVAAA